MGIYWDADPPHNEIQSILVTPLNHLGVEWAIYHIIGRKEGWPVSKRHPELLGNRWITKPRNADQLDPLIQHLIAIRGALPGRDSTESINPLMTEKIAEPSTLLSAARGGMIKAGFCPDEIVIGFPKTIRTQIPIGRAMSKIAELLEFLGVCKSRNCGFTVRRSHDQGRP